MTPELWQLAFAVAGAALGWWLRHQAADAPAPQAAPTPPLLGLLTALERALTQRQQQQAHQELAGLLNDVVAAAPVKTPPKT
jgi:hypothetical protein